jgi:hypothetical protein
MSGRRGRNPLPFVVNSTTFRAPFSINRAFGSFIETASNTINLPMPAGAAGQMLVALIGYRNSTTFSMPSGWTQIQQVATADTSAGGQVSGLMAWKIRGGSEPTAAFLRGGGNRALGVVIGYTPSEGGLTFDTSSAFAQPGATTALAGTALTVAASDSLLVAMTVVAGGDGAFGQTFSAAGLGTPASGPSQAVGPAVLSTQWGETYWFSQGITSPLVAAHGFDLARAPAGSTGAFSATSSVSSRGLVIAAAFSRTP